MVSNNPNPSEGFYLDPSGMALPGLGPFTTTMAASEDLSKKIRKPYTITKSRESWTEPEHDKFLEALQLFDRDWKKIEAFVGSKTVIQIRSHAQKYFLKVQKTGGVAHESHLYYLSVAMPSQVPGSFQSTSPLLEPGCTIRPDSSSILARPAPGGAVPSWPVNSVQPLNSSQVPTTANNCCSSTESPSKACPLVETIDQGSNPHSFRVLPDFTQVYSFIGSVFDPNASGHLQKLKRMDPIDVETVLLLMRNLSINLISPDFEDHRRLLSSYEIDSGPIRHGDMDKPIYVDDHKPKLVAN
ncbi:Protein REVEILLE 6, partial [Cucurbita argyrosperma subsp. sororia]